MKEHNKFIETDRLLLRSDTLKEYIAFFSTHSDEEIKQHFGIQNDEMLQVQKNKIKGSMVTYRTSLVIFSLIEKASNTVVGSCSFHNWFPMHNRSEIGYNIVRDAFKNKGFMKEALPYIINYGFEQMQLNRIEAFVHPDNTPSLRLIEGNGFFQEGLLRQHYNDDGVLGDSIIYGLLKQDHYSKQQ